MIDATRYAVVRLPDVDHDHLRGLVDALELEVAHVEGAAVDVIEPVALSGSDVDNARAYVVPPPQGSRIADVAVRAPYEDGPSWFLHPDDAEALAAQLLRAAHAAKATAP